MLPNLILILNSASLQSSVAGLDFEKSCHDVIDDIGYEFVCCPTNKFDVYMGFTAKYFILAADKLIGNTKLSFV